MDKLNFFDQDSFSRQALLRRLHRFAQELEPGSEIIVIGASAVLLQLQTLRQTYDIDILNTVRSGAYSKYDIQLVNAGILSLCPDYRQRLVHITEVGSVRIYSLGLLDVALVKLGRGLEKDLDDIREILRSGQVTLAEFTDKYREFRALYGGSNYIIDQNFQAVTGLQVKPDDRLF